VFNPATGEIEAQVALASAADLDAAVRSAAAAQAGWAAVNPQRRARVLMKFVDLLNRNMQPLAELMSREHLPPSWAKQRQMLGISNRSQRGDEPVSA
jgi:malonate-semialdehyde dehydrogenase (acetylating)/methylmalonate-semialdehyde dehydrogenase